MPHTRQEPKFTKGPWKQSPYGNNFIYGAPATDGMMRALIIKPEIEARGRSLEFANEADAPLVVASPDMYDLLCSLYDYMLERQDAEYFTDSAAGVPNEEMNFANEIEAVLSKARGE